MARKKKTDIDKTPIDEKLFKGDEFIIKDDDDDFDDEFDDIDDWDDEEEWEDDDWEAPPPAGPRLDIHVNVNINVNSAADLDKYEKSIKRILDKYFLN